MEMPNVDPFTIAKKDRLITRLLQVLPDDAVIHEPEETRAYECDALTAYRCPPLAAVLPRTTDEVAAILKICHDMEIPVVPAGRAHRWPEARCRPPIRSFWASPA